MLQFGHRSLRSVCVVALVLLGASCSEAERTTPATTPARVPDLVHARVAVAAEQVRAAGLRPELRSASGDLAPEPACGASTVTAQEPPADTELVRGSAVSLTVDCTVTTPAP